MKELYTADIARRWASRRRGYAALAAIMAVVGLAVCILLCSRADTAYEEERLAQVIALSTLCGWAVILLLKLAIAPARAQERHIAGILEEAEREEAQGVLTVHKQRWVIPHSIAFRKATLVSGGETRTVHINARMARLLPQDGATVRVTLVRRYITAWEVIA